MKSLAIIGAGGHAKVVADAALISGWESVTFFDDKWPIQERIEAWIIAGSTATFLEKSHEFDGVIVAIGNNTVRLEKTKSFLASNLPLVTIIHQAAVVSPFAKIDPGTVIFATAVLNPFCHIGLGAIINTGAVIEHDCLIGQGVHVSPGVNLGGGVQVGDLSWIGIGASVRQSISIGNKVMVGAGAVVVKDVPNQCVVAGVPATIQNKKESMC